MAVSENDLIVGPLVPANGVSVISLDFYFEDEAWLEVYKNDSETPLVLSVDYTTTGEGTATGTVVLTTPANGTDAYSVYLVVPLERTSDMQLRGEFRSEPFNLEMDRMWQALQGRRTASDRTMRFASAGQTLTPIYIPSAAAGAGRNLRISDDGLGLEISTYTEAELAAAQVNAEASAVAAAASAATAEAARDATLAAYDNFDDRYLGEFATPPTTDNDGDPLASGMLYFDTVTEAMKVYSETSMAWLDAYASGETFIAKATFTAADQMLYSTAAGVPATTPITAVGRAILDDATIADVRNTIQASRVPLDEDDFASNSALHPPTQQSTGVYVRTMAGNQSGDAPIYAARAWAKFSTAGGTVSLTESGNVTSITDNGTGDYTVNFTTDMEDVNFATVATATYRGASALEGATAYTQTVSSVVVRSFEGSGGTAVDPGGMNVAVFR